MIIITGASGFLGAGLVQLLQNYNINEEIVGVTRNPSGNGTARFKSHQIDNYRESGWLSRISKDISTIIHCAGLAHVTKMDTNSPKQLEEFKDANMECTLDLARQAAKAGVKRFIFISTIGVNGDATEIGKPFKPKDTPNPKDLYSLSKFWAENGLKLISRETDLDVIIIRPPLIYGPGVKGNLKSLLWLLSLNIPLPLANIKNLRSFVALENLAKLLELCIRYESPINQPLFVSDCYDIGTSDLLKIISNATENKLRLLNVPHQTVRAVSKLFGLSSRLDKLYNSLQVDVEETKRILQWQPTVSLEEGIREMVVTSNNVKYTTSK